MLKQMKYRFAVTFGTLSIYIYTIVFRRGYRISVRGGRRDFLGTKLFSGIRNKIQEKRYKTRIV